jgi:hypothetical protein
MESSKKTTLTVVIIIVILIIAGIFWFSRGSSPSNSSPSASSPTDSSVNASSPTDLANGAAPVAVSETTKVSGSLSEYQNAELGFSVKYPSTWEKEEINSGVTFIVPIDSSQVSTVATLQGNIQVISGTCAFPPVTTVQDRSTVKVGTLSFNTISISNSVQGRDYFNHMYSLQNGKICYMFSFASIALAPSSKNLTGSNITQAENNNKAIVNATDGAFLALVKSFAYVTTPAGESETTAAPTKK